MFRGAQDAEVVDVGQNLDFALRQLFDSCRDGQGDSLVDERGDGGSEWQPRVDVLVDSTW